MRNKLNLIVRNAKTIMNISQDKKITKKFFNNLFFVIASTTTHYTYGASESSMALSKQSAVPFESLENRCARAIAKFLIDDPQGHVAQNFEHVLPTNIKRRPMVHYISNMLQKKIGWKRHDISTGEDTVAELMAITSNTLACTYDGKHLFSGSLNGTLRAWDIDAGSMRTIGQHPELILFLACTADGSHIFSSAEQSIREWNTIQGTFNEYPMLLYSPIACTSNGEHIFISPQGDHVVEQRSNTTHPNLELKEGVHIRRIACSADGTRVFIGLNNADQYLWDRQTNTVRLIRNPWTGSPVRALTCDTKGDRCFSVTANRYFATWSASKKDVSAPQGKRHESEISAIACQADGKRVFTGTKTGTLYVSEDKYSMQPIGQIDHIYKNQTIKTDILSLACSGDGSRVFTASPFLLTMWSDYLQDFSILDDNDLNLLFQIVRTVHEKKELHAIDLQDARLIALLSRYNYLQDERLFTQKPTATGYSSSSSSTFSSITSDPGCIIH